MQPALSLFLMSPDTQWQAVLARDASHDGRLFYAVRTTGIFCRPSCPSRRPKRNAVEFFSSGSEAERAGYRPCKRCRPTEHNRQAAAVEKARQFIDRNLQRNITLAELAEHVGLSSFHLQRLFKKIVGVSAKEYQNSQRLTRFKRKLRGQRSVTDAIYAAGYGSNSRVYETTNQKLGMTPAQYRRKGEGIVIRYTSLQTSLGTIMIAATEKGICRLRMGESDKTMFQELREEFSAAMLQSDDKGLKHYASAIKSYLGGNDHRLNLPLDVQATVFQQRVWKELRAIPYGKTRSYTEVAEKIGNPKAVRAVARACATNPVALVTPCHRVIRESGEPAGYRWGLERKAALLEMEKKKG